MGQAGMGLCPGTSPAPARPRAHRLSPGPHCRCKHRQQTPRFPGTNRPVGTGTTRGSKQRSLAAEGHPRKLPSSGEADSSPSWVLSSACIGSLRRLRAQPGRCQGSSALLVAGSPRGERGGSSRSRLFSPSTGHSHGPELQGGQRESPLPVAPGGELPRAVSARSGAVRGSGGI